MKKPTLKRKPKDIERPQRITNETVAEHRERILAGGRRFKYPVQYAKHRLVFNAVIISVVALFLVGLFGWWQLYKLNNTSDFAYRTTKVLPLPVASVDGATARYSDYLMRYRSQKRLLTQQGLIEQGKDDSERQLNYFKRQVLDGLEMDTYAAKLAKEQGVSVTDAEIDAAVLRSSRTATGTISQDTFDASALEAYGYTPAEYRLLYRQGLLRQKVAYAMDDQAKVTSNELLATLKSQRNNFEKTAQILGKGVETSTSGMVSKTNNDYGLVAAATKLKVGEVSPVIKSTSGDGYYVVKLIDIDDTKLNYQSIKVPLTKFIQQFHQLKTDHKINEYISIPEIDTQANTLQ